MDALANAFADADRLVMSAKSGRPSAVDRELATQSNWLSRQYANLSQDLERYSYFRDTVFTCVKVIASRIAGQPVRVARPKKAGRRGLKAFGERLGTKAFVQDLQLLPDHDLAAAFAKPNPVMVGSSLLFSIVGSLLLTGKSNTWIADDDQGGKELWPLPSHWCRAKDPLMETWIVRPWQSAIEFEVPGDRMLYIHHADPSNPFGAISTLASQAATVTTEENIITAERSMFSNGIFPAMGVVIGDPLNPEDPTKRGSLDRAQKEQITDALRKLHGGAGRFGNFIILDALIREIQKLSISPNEIPFLDSAKFTRAKIFQAFGVNPLIVGEIEGATYAQAWVAEKSFIENTVGPIVQLISQAFTRWLVPAFAGGSDSLVCFVEMPQAHDPETRMKELELGLTSGAMLRNEYRQAVLGLQPIPAFEQPIQPMNMVPAGEDDAGDDGEKKNGIAE